MTASPQRRYPIFLAAAVLTVVATACQVVIVPPGPPADAIETSIGNFNTPRHVDQVLAPGATLVYELNVPSSGSGVIYVELDREIELELRGDGTNYPTVQLSSNSSSYFGQGTLGLSSAEAAATEGTLTGQAIGSPINCRGSCVIFQSSAGTRYARVRNDTGATMVFDLYFFVDPYADEFEPFNDSIITAPYWVGPVGSWDEGAIETVGDVDFWIITDQDGYFAFDNVLEGNPNNLALELYIIDSFLNEEFGPYYPGEEIDVLPQDILRVEAANPGLAAASARSGYRLEYVEGVALRTSERAAARAR